MSDDYIPTQQEVDEELHACARYGELETLQEMKESDDTNMLNFNALDAQGNTALHKAAANNHVEILKYLVENKAQYILNENKVGPITWAILNRHFEATKYLLDTFSEFIDVIEQPLSGLSPLSTALSLDCTDIATILLAHPSAEKNCPVAQDASDDDEEASNDENTETPTDQAEASTAAKTVSTETESPLEQEDNTATDLVTSTENLSL